MRIFYIVTVAALLIGPSAQAQQQFIQYSAGTGFYINREGHIITNAHVVRACQSITVHTQAGDVPATLVASDPKTDLAVLKVRMNAQATAPMRWNIADLKTGTEVYLYGFPGGKMVPSFVKSVVVGLQGPSDEPQWLQLKSVAQHGNSGGPVLDSSGNVIAVITGNLVLQANAATTPERQTDYAITLAALQDFLRLHQVPYYEAASGMVAYAEPIIARNAAQFVFPIQCVQGIVTAPAAGR